MMSRGNAILSAIKFGIIGVVISVSLGLIVGFLGKLFI